MIMQALQYINYAWGDQIRTLLSAASFALACAGLAVAWRAVVAVWREGRR